VRCVQNQTSWSSTAKCARLDRVLDRLLGQPVLELERHHRESVDEQAEVQRELRLIPAVPQLTRDAEDVGLGEPQGIVVARRRCAVEEVDRCRTVLYLVTKDVYDTAFGDLTLQAREELLPSQAIAAQFELLVDARLCRLDER